MGSKRPKVQVLFEQTMDYRGSLVRIGTEQHLLIIKKDICAALHKAVGDKISLELCLDTQPRTVELPTELKKALEAAPQAAAFFQTLSYTCQKEYTNYIQAAKRATTKERRTLKTIELLQKEIKTPQ